MHNSSSGTCIFFQQSESLTRTQHAREAEEAKELWEAEVRSRTKLGGKVGPSPLCLVTRTIALKLLFFPFFVFFVFVRSLRWKNVCAHTKLRSMRCVCLPGSCCCCCCCLLFVCLFVCLSFIFCLYQEMTCTFIFIPSQLNVCFICLFVCLLSIPLGSFRRRRRRGRCWR